MKVRIVRLKDKYTPQRKNFLHLWVNMYAHSFSTEDEAIEAAKHWIKTEKNFHEYITPRVVKEFDL